MKSRYRGVQTLLDCCYPCFLSCAKGQPSKRNIIQISLLYSYLRAGILIMLANSKYLDWIDYLSRYQIMKKVQIVLVLIGISWLGNCFTFAESGPLVGAEMIYNGNGFTKELQDDFKESINDATVFYNGKYSIQAWYIKKNLEKLKAGVWNIIIATSLNITKISDISTGFYYWSFSETWALWYNVSTHNPNTLYIAIYNGPDVKSSCNVTTQEPGKGDAVSVELAEVIHSITDTLDSTQDIAKYIQKYDGRKWSVLSFPMFFNNDYPKAYAALDVDDVWISYKESVTMGGQKYSQILFV